MADILNDMRKVTKLNGDTYSSAEVLGMISRGANEIARLQEAKRRALALADERAIEANGVRAENERLRRTETCARLVLKAWETAGAATAQPLTDSMVRLRDALAAEQEGDGK